MHQRVPRNVCMRRSAIASEVLPLFAALHVLRSTADGTRHAHTTQQRDTTAHDLQRARTAHIPSSGPQAAPTARPSQAHKIDTTGAAPLLLSLHPAAVQHAEALSLLLPAGSARAQLASEFLHGRGAGGRTPVCFSTAVVGRGNLQVPSRHARVCAPVCTSPAVALGCIHNARSHALTNARTLAHMAKHKHTTRAQSAIGRCFLSVR
jgi:hypothetical protein